MDKMKKQPVLLTLTLLLSIVTLSVVCQNNTIAHAQASINVQILPSVGGTTDPGPGNYTYTEGDGRAILTATPESGWQFSYWLFSGPYSAGHKPGVMESNQIYANPADVTHNYDYGGYSYTYQAVFVPSSIASRPLGIPIEYFLPLAIVIIVIAGIVAVVAYSLGKRATRPALK
jgi:hypothetical protein